MYQMKPPGMTGGRVTIAERSEIFDGLLTHLRNIPINVYKINVYVFFTRRYKASLLEVLILAELEISTCDGLV